MNEETIKAMSDAFAPVAEKIGSGAEYGWEVMVMGQFAEGVALLVIAVITSAMFFLLYKKCMAYEKTTSRYDSGAGYGVMFVTGVFVLPGILMLLYFGVLKAFAPEYSALMMLVRGVIS